MKAKQVYTTEQWERVSALPLEFFRQYASLVTKKNLLTSIHLDKIVNQGQSVENPFNEESLYELFHGNFDGLILACVMKNQHLFVRD